MKKDPGIPELEKARAELLAALCPVERPSEASRSEILDRLDPSLVRSLMTGLSLLSEASGYSPQAQRFVAEVLAASPEARRAHLAKQVQLLKKVLESGADQVQSTAEGMLEAAFPVRVRRTVVACVTSGCLRERPFSGKEIEHHARAANLPPEEVRKRADCVPVLDAAQLEQVLAMLRRQRDNIALALDHYLKARELAEQLIQSERMRSLGALSGGVAHHFNNLLSVILGYSSYVLNREKLSKEAAEALQKITESAQQGRRLTEELLAFAGSEAEDEAVCRIHEKLTNVLSLLASQAPSSVKVETHLGAERDDVLAPPSSIQQIVFNLLTNAFDSMPSGGQLTVMTENTDLETEAGLQPCIRIQVADSGGVLPQGFREQQTEPPAVEELPPGDRTALKLSSVYGIVGRLDGTVIVSSTPGSRTRVEVLLPLAAGAQRAAAGARRRRRLAPSTIWVVDDDPTFREMCGVVLAEEGHTVEKIENGLAMQKKWAASKRPPDLLIIDFSMPEYNGLELCQWLARQGSRVPVVLVSGLSANQPDIHKALEMKRTFFLQKPFTFREMADVVTVAMGETLIGE